MPPRVRIPQSPPMCYKCEKRSLGREIYDLDSKINNLFKKVDNDPLLLNDEAMIMLMNTMAEKIDKYRKM